MGNGAMIILIFGILILVPLGIVLTVLKVNRTRRQKKKKNYKGATYGKVEKMVNRGGPTIIYVVYKVNGMEYKIHETAKLKSEAIRVGGKIIGQRKTFVLESAKIGNEIKILYDEQHPERAIIDGNDGWMNR